MMMRVMMMMVMMMTMTAYHSHGVVVDDADESGGGDHGDDKSHRFVWQLGRCFCLNLSQRGKIWVHVSQIPTRIFWNFCETTW